MKIIENYVDISQWNYTANHNLLGYDCFGQGDMNIIYFITNETKKNLFNFIARARQSLRSLPTHFMALRKCESCTSLLAREEFRHAEKNCLIKYLISLINDITYFP